MSTATAALVAPRKPGPTLDNPLMMPFATSLASTAQGLVETLNAPDVTDELGLVDGQDSLTVKTTGTNAATSANAPFLYVTGFSTQPERALSIVSEALGLAQDQLASQQRNFRVSRSDVLRLTLFVEPTSPIVAPGVREVMAGIVLLAGLGITLAVVCVIDRYIRRRSRRSQASVNGSDLSPMEPRFTYHPELDGPPRNSDGALLR
jgi:hypothetical protein